MPERTPINNQAALPPLSLVFQNSACLPCHDHRPHFFLLPNNETYTRVSRILRSKLTGPRISPSPPVNAPEPQAPSRPPLRSTSHKISPTSGLNLASTAETSTSPASSYHSARANNSSVRKVDRI